MLGADVQSERLPSPLTSVGVAQEAQTEYIKRRVFHIIGKQLLVLSERLKGIHVFFCCKGVALNRPMPANSSGRNCSGEYPMHLDPLRVTHHLGDSIHLQH